MAAEDAHERAEARRAEAERADRADKSHEQSLAAYRAAAEQRGEVVSALALASGEVAGRSLAEVFADALDASAHEDARTAARERRESGEVVFIDEPVIHGASRSAWPESERELDRMLRRAADLHTDLVMTQQREASRRGRGAEHIEAHRAAAERGHERDARRSQPTSVLTARSGPVPPDYREITRVCTPDGNMAWPS
jgi:hypothetical protein